MTQDKNHEKLLDALNHISPVGMEYKVWAAIGMALKEEGLTVDVWDDWSQKDQSRYIPGNCQTHWDSFGSYSGKLATGGTIIHMAKENGWTWKNGESTAVPLDWNATIGDSEDGVVIKDKSWLETSELYSERWEKQPTDWDPGEQVKAYINALFRREDHVGYVVTCHEQKGSYKPSDGAYDRTAGELLDALDHYDGKINCVFGDYNKEAGAWIRFNPLDGEGQKNANVTEYRYALVESDTMDLDTQEAMIRKLELPVAVLSYSGGKSLHAIVKIGASDEQEYRERVDYLYGILKKNGMEVDTQNKNPSRLSRFPGFQRGSRYQFIVDQNFGKPDFETWRDWIEGINDDLPDAENLQGVLGHLPELAPPLIENVLRQGHKMLIAGPSKAGKSFALIQLSIAIAEGKEWLGRQCAQGKVLYVNLEVDRASCLHRFNEVYKAMQLCPEHADNIDIWNLRGKACPMDKLAPKLIRRAAQKNYIAVIIDPIYKVLTGDENSASEMAAFCNQFDRVATELNTSVIYCHHHSKGAQGAKKAMDRSSGSGVFARDPDAVIDMTELRITNNMDIPGELKNCPAYRIEGSLREFKSLDPIDVWFCYPVHIVDNFGVLKSSRIESGIDNARANNKKCVSDEEQLESLNRAYEETTAFKAGNEPIFAKDLAPLMGVTDKTVLNRVDKFQEYYQRSGNTIWRISDCE